MKNEPHPARTDISVPPITAPHSQNNTPPDPPAELWSLLERQAMLYTGGDSCSLPEELAQELLRSVGFCLSFGAGRGLGEGQPPAGRLRAAQTALLRETEKAKAMYRLARCGTPLADNAYFRDTLRGLDGYFKSYDIRFFAHAQPNIDYPLAAPVDEALPGVLYAQIYLRRLVTEMRLLACFAPGRVRALWDVWLPGWPHLCAGLCEPVFTAALGLALLGEDPRGLSMDEPARAALWALLRGQSARPMAQTLAAGAARLCNRLELWDGTTRGYLAGLTPGLVPLLRSADRQGWAKLFPAC